MQIVKKVKGSIRLLLHFVLLVITVVGVAQDNANKKFTINVSVANLKSPAKLILTIRDVNQWAEYVSESNDGKFVLSGALREPSFAWLVMKYETEKGNPPRRGNVTELFISYAPIKVVTKDSLTIAKIDGGHLEEELKELNSLTGKCKTEKCSNDLRSDIIGGFIDKHPSSFVSLFAIQNFSGDGNFIVESKYAEPLFQKLSPSLKNTLSGKELSDDIRIATQTAIGAISPEFIQKDTSDRNVSLKSFRGKYVLIDFWASWCGPCRLENPQLVKTFNEYEGKNFTVLSVSLDSKKANWTKAIRKDRLTWTHVSDLKFWKNEVALLYGVKTVPQNFLLDPDGKIVGKNIRAADLEGVLKSVIK